MKISVQFILPLSWLALSGCYRDQPQGNHAFVFPSIINSSISDTLVKAKWSVDCMMASNPIYIGKFKMEDVIDIAHYHDTTLMVDQLSPGSDSCNATGLELYADYNQSVYMNWGRRDTTFAYYPVIVANRTPSLKIFRGKDTHVDGLQEARNKEFMGCWHPIEHKGFDICGNGVWWTMLHPGELIILLLTKYEGDTEAPMRVRILNQGNVYLSQPFLGTIHSGQFRFCNQDIFSGEGIDQYDIKCTFFGAIPFELDSALMAEK